MRHGAGRFSTPDRRDAIEMNPDAPIAAIVLAAGGSKRMGSPKQAAIFRGESLLRRAASAALGTTARPVVVVLGSGAEEVEKELVGLGVSIVVNRDWAEGMASSIGAGLHEAERITPGIDGALLTVCDQPFATSTLLESLLRSRRGGRHPIVACSYGGSLGVPALFGRERFDDLLALIGAEGARRILGRLRHEVHSLPFPGGEFDVDTPDDLARLVSEEARRP